MRARQGRALGGGLDLDEPVVAGHHDVGVHLRRRVLDVVEIEQRHAAHDPTVEIAATLVVSGETIDRALGPPAAGTASASATLAPVIDAVRVPPSAVRTSQSRQRVRAPSASKSMTARSERPMRRWISGRARRARPGRCRAVCGRRWRRGASSIGGDPAADVACHPARDASSTDAEQIRASRPSRSARPGRSAPTPAWNVVGRGSRRRAPVGALLITRTSKKSDTVLFLLLRRHPVALIPQRDALDRPHRQLQEARADLGERLGVAGAQERVGALVPRRASRARAAASACPTRRAIAVPDVMSVTPGPRIRCSSARTKG